MNAVHNCDRRSQFCERRSQFSIVNVGANPRNVGVAPCYPYWMLLRFIDRISGRKLGSEEI